MKKFILGLIIGLAIAIPVGAHAEAIVSMIGKQVQGSYPVKLRDVALNDQAVVIDGTSYLPVRAVGEALGFDVIFDASTGITLKDKPVDEKVKNDPSYQKAMKGQELLDQSNALTKQIVELYKIIEPYETHANAGGKSLAKPIDDTYTTTKAKRDDLMKQRDDIDKQLETLRNQP